MKKFPEADLGERQVGHHFIPISMSHVLGGVANRRSATLPPHMLIRGDISVAKQRKIPRLSTRQETETGIASIRRRSDVWSRQPKATTEVLDILARRSSLLSLMYTHFAAATFTPFTCSTNTSALSKNGLDNVSTPPRQDCSYYRSFIRHREVYGAGIRSDLSR